MKSQSTFKARIIDKNGIHHFTKPYSSQYSVRYAALKLLNILFDNQQITPKQYHVYKSHISIR